MVDLLELFSQVIHLVCQSGLPLLKQFLHLPKFGLMLLKLVIVDDVLYFHHFIEQ